MAGRPEEYPPELREYILAQVVDHKRPLQPIVIALNRGQCEDFGKVPISRATCRRWIALEERLRQDTAPLEGPTLDAFLERLFRVAGGELRRLERATRKGEAIDPKRLLTLEAFAASVRRQITAANVETAPETEAATTADSPLLERLAAEDLAD